jgi:hypothetical protein
MVPVYKLTGLQAGAVVLLLLFALAFRRATAARSFSSP